MQKPNKKNPLIFILLLTTFVFESAQAALPANFKKPIPPSSPAMIDVGIFGKDKRETAYDDVMFSAVHRLDTGEGTCTAFFVDRQYLLTAGHCVNPNIPVKVDIDRNGKFVDSISTDTAWYGSGYYAYGVDEYGRRYTQDDFGIVRAVRLAPNDIAILEIAKPRELKKGMAAMSVGYPSYIYKANVRVKDKNCKVREISGEIIRTDCGISRGNSGGPLLIEVSPGKWKVAGIASTQYMKANGGGMIYGEKYDHSIANYYTNITLKQDLIFKTIKENKSR